jgi:hypothetical protein
LLLAFKDMIDLPGAQLRAKRYKNYQGVPNQWANKTILDKHIVSVAGDRVAHFDEDHFFQDIQAPDVRAELEKIKYQLEHKG